MAPRLPPQVLHPRAAPQRRGGGAAEAGGGALRQAGRLHGHDERGRRDGFWGRDLRHTVSPRHPAQVLHPQPPGVALRHRGGTNPLELSHDR